MPLFVSYLKIIVLLLAPFVIGIPSALVIGIIAVERELHTNYYFFIVNMLVIDFFEVVVNSLVRFVALIIYVYGNSVKLSCIFTKIFSTFSFTGQLLFITLWIDWFVAITSPYHYLKIMNCNLCHGCGIAISNLITSVLLAHVPCMHL